MRLTRQESPAGASVSEGDADASWSRYQRYRDRVFLSMLQSQRNFRS